MRIKITPCAACAALFILLIATATAAEQPNPSISLLHPSTASLETTEDSITVSGSAVAEGRLAKVYCVDQFAQRHEGVFGEQDQHGAATWEVPDITLQSGVNLLTVIIVDAANRSASLHLAVNKKAAPDSPPASTRKLGSGMLQNRPIVYQIANGQAVVEGDIIVHPTPSSSPGGLNQAAATSTITPDFAISYTSQLWPKNADGVSQIPYTVSGSAANLTTALANFNQNFTGLIQFVGCSPPTNTTCSLATYVAISVVGGSGEGASYVGVAPSYLQPQPLQCGSGCTVAGWLHEMGHTIGLLHEHQRPDRGNYITLNLKNADLPNVPGNFTLFSYDYQIIGLYDYASVMHYCAFCFSKANQPVLESIPAGIPLGNEVGYSAGDVDQIERLYGTAPSDVTVTTNPTGLQIIVDGITYTAPHTFSFALNSTHTLALPADPQYTNPADGSTYAFGNWNDLGARSHTIYVIPGSGTLVSPSKKAAVTVYEANYTRLQPFAFLSPPVYPSGSGSVSVTPEPTAEFGGSFFVDRTLVSLEYTKNSGYSFYDWYNLPLPPSDNPHSFYIQAPTTSAQAVFAPTKDPVTIVGESITGPNTWNPLVSGYVDTVWTTLPAGFTAFNDYNPTWTPGSSHSVSVDQAQSPVTTNIYYNWNSWSDGGAITHNVVQPNTGNHTVTASFTPFYATYTLAASCAGGVTTFPAATPYSGNTSFNFYEDGTSVMSTATANSAFPQIAFAGWTGTTGGLAGKTNPQTLTIHGQFVPTANFNVTPTPMATTTALTITSLEPTSMVASATAAPAITVKGTGFVNGYTYAYWNGSYRAVSGVTATQISVQLQAGDLATPGGQDLFVGNYTSSPVGCSATTEASFTVDATGHGKATTTATLTPATLTFVATAVGSSAPAQTLTLKNTGTASLTIGSIAVWGTNASSFTLGSNTCGATLAAAASCTFAATFTPTLAGALTGTIAITDDASGSPQTVTLKGTGTAPAVTLTPTAITFAATVGSTSAAKTISLKNTGTIALSIASIAIGGADPSSFVLQSSNCGSMLAAAATCTLGVAFKPAATGTFTGTVVVTDNAAGSPQAVTLHGTGST